MKLTITKTETEEVEFNSLTGREKAIYYAGKENASFTGVIFAIFLSLLTIVMYTFIIYKHCQHTGENFMTW